MSDSRDFTAGSVLYTSRLLVTAAIPGECGSAP
jgi:hypothetical protein